MTQTQTSTWWRTWAAWTGWVSPSLVSEYLPQSESDKGASHQAPWRLQTQVDNNSQTSKYPSLCVPETGTVGRTVVIRRLDFPVGLDPLFFPFPFFLSHSVALPPSFPSTLCCHFIAPLSQWNPELSSGRNHSLFSESVSFGLGNCSQTNQSRTVRGPVTEVQHGSVFPHLSSFSLYRIRSAPSLSPLHTSWNSGTSVWPIVSLGTRKPNWSTN